MNSSVSVTMIAATTDDSPVFAPEAKFTAERENEPLAGKHLVNAPKMLARPWPTSSWVGVEALTGSGGDGLGDRDRLHEPDQRDDERSRQELRDRRPVKPGHAECGQAGGNRAHHLAAAGEAHAVVVDHLDAPAACARARGRVLHGAARILGLLEHQLAEQPQAPAVLALQVLDSRPMTSAW